MQQHSQIVELKDRLQKSIDDSYNVKDINEVTRVISVLERMHVTREDLEKTRLGKTINELRRKTTDKELAKRSKKLIKTWQSLMVSTSNGHAKSSSNPSAYSQQQPDEHSPANTQDEDSNSSVFSNLSVDGIALANSRSLLGSPSAPLITTNNVTKNQHKNHILNNNSSRKRKSEIEADTLRENLNSMISGGRRLQTTQELAQKYNIQIKPSLSASSSPHLQINNKNDSLSPAKRPKINGTSYRKNGFNHHDENSSHELENGFSGIKNHRYNNKSLPASPALQSLRNSTSSHSANTSPALLSQAQLFENDAVTRPNLKVKIGKLSRQTSPAIATESISAESLPNGKAATVSSDIKTESKHNKKSTRGTTERTVSEVDRDIREIYAQLPQISPDDLEWKEMFKFDTDEPFAEEPALEEQIKAEGQVTITDTCDDDSQALPKQKYDDDEYELFEYSEEYEELEDEEVEVTDDEAGDEDDDAEIEPCQRVDLPKEDERHNDLERKLDTEADLGSSSCAPQLPPDHTMGDILQCDKPSRSVDEGQADDESGGLEKVQAEPDSLYNSCDHEPTSNEAAISSSTSDALKRQEADSTTVDEAGQGMDMSPECSTSHQMSDDECVTSTEEPGAKVLSPCTTTAPATEHANGTVLDESQMDCSTNSAEAPSSPTLVPETAVDPLDMFFVGCDDFLADIELLTQSCYTDPSGEFYSQFPPSTPQPAVDEETSPSAEETVKATPLDAVNQSADASAALVAKDEPMEVSKSFSRSHFDDDSSSSSDSEDDNDDDDDDSSDDGASEADQSKQQPPSEEFAQPAEVLELSQPEGAKRVRRRTKRVIMPVLKKKHRKCVARSKVRRVIVDRISNEQWENVNGNFDKDGLWHDFGEMTSAYVLTGGLNAANVKAEENVLHILPYVNYTW